MTAAAQPPTIVGPLTTTALAVGAVYGCWRFFVATAQGQLLDELALRGSEIGSWRLDDQALRLLDTVSVPAVAVAMAVVLLVGLLRREYLGAVLAAGAVGLANVTTQVLKYWVLDRPVLAGAVGVARTANSLPSGHATVAAAAVVGLMLVVPPVLRSVTAFLGAGVVTAFGYATQLVVLDGEGRVARVVAAHEEAADRVPAERVVHLGLDPPRDEARERERAGEQHRVDPRRPPAAATRGRPSPSGTPR